MGVATCADLISEGLLLAGDTDLTLRGVVWLNQWLRSQYRAWPWPFLKRRASGLTLSSASQSLVVGAGSGGVTGVIQQIHDPFYLYTSDKATRGTARTSQLLDGDISFDEDVRNTTTQIGLPTKFKVRPTATLGQFTLIPDPIPDRAYLLSFDYMLQPDDIASGTTGGTGLPLYPNDRTMVHAVASMALLHMGDERASEMRDLVRAFCIDDRMKFGSIPGINDNWGLDKGTFR